MSKEHQEKSTKKKKSLFALLLAFIAGLAIVTAIFFWALRMLNIRDESEVQDKQDQAG